MISGLGEKVSTVSEYIRQARRATLVGSTAFLWLCLGFQYMATELRLNDDGYFEARRFNLMPFETDYNSVFFDEKTSGLSLFTTVFTLLLEVRCV